MPKQPYKDVTEHCKSLRRKELEKICYDELTPEEFEIFMLRVYNSYQRERVATDVGRCKESISKIFMRAVRKLRSYFNLGGNNE